MRDRQQHSLRRVSYVSVGRDVILGDYQGAVRGLRVVDEEAAVGAILRMERKTKQPPLPACHNLQVNVQEYGWHGCTRLQHADDPALLDDEETFRAVSRVPDKDRTIDAARNYGGKLDRGEEGRWQTEEP